MEKYLRHYAEPETAALESWPGHEKWANVLVIPARNESHDFLLGPPSCEGRSLVVLVINGSASSPRQVSSGNWTLASWVQAKFEILWRSASRHSGYGLCLLRSSRAPQDVLLVDRFSEGRELPDRGGVGHARKIGADLAASLIFSQRITSRWIHCSDADVRLPPTYFTCSDESHHAASRIAALVYPFRHRTESIGPERQKEILAFGLYELSLRFYVAGMKYAGSPYAFHTIGSTMAIDATHYAKVRGFPKREAGEDFYLLNKVAKVGHVLQLRKNRHCEPIEIAARRSDRVPFGTGAAVNKIVNLEDPLTAFRFYNPMVFTLLRLWLQSWPEVWRSQAPELSASILAGQSGENIRPHQVQSLLASLKSIGTERALEHAFRQSGNADQFYRQMHIWFDAFRSLKLVHALRDQYLPSIIYAELGAKRVFHRLLAQDPDLSEYYEHLNNSL